MSKLAVALIGFGTAGSVFHAPLIAASPQLALRAVVTGDPARKDEVLRVYPQADVLASADHVFERAGDFDVVVIATPHTTHIDLARRAIGAGLHVVIDKPVDVSARAARKFHEDLVLQGVSNRVGIFQNRRWDGDFLTLGDLIDSGKLGEIHRFESRFERWRPTPRAGSWRELAPRSEGGGVLLDLGSHLVDQAVQLFGDVSSVYAQEFSRRPAVTAGDDVFISLQHRAGPVSHLSATATAAILAPRFRLSGSQGAFEKYGMDIQEAQLRKNVDPLDEQWGVEQKSSWGDLALDTHRSAYPTVTGRWPWYYQAVADAVKTKTALPGSLASVLHPMEVLDAAERSASTGQVVNL